MKKAIFSLCIVATAFSAMATGKTKQVIKNVGGAAVKAAAPAAKNAAINAATPTATNAGGKVSTSKTAVKAVNTTARIGKAAKTVSDVSDAVQPVANGAGLIDAAGSLLK